MTVPRSELPRAKGMSLERKLPLLMTGVLLAILGGGVLLAYREIRRAAEVVATGRLRDFTDGLAGAAALAPPRISEQLRDVARDPVIQRVLTGGTPSSGDLTAVRALLSDLETRADSGLVSELWSRDGRVIASVGGPRSGDDQHTTGAVVTGPDSLAMGAFYASGGRIYYWNTRPVTGPSGRIGTLAQRRRLNSQRGTENEIKRLAGQDVRVLFRNADGTLWTTLDGRPINKPVGLEVIRGMQTFSHPDVRTDGRVIVSEKAVPRTPWTVVLELPVAALSDGPRQMLRRFVLMSVVLLLIGAIALWLISRRITSPLARLTAAAEGIARGDLSQRVAESGEYEIARLGESFNHMASEIASANTALQASALAAAKAKEAAEGANASKSNFLAAMSHELRTPLNAIAGYVDLLELELHGPLTPDQRADLLRVKRSQKYLLGLIEEILVFSQLDAQRLAFTIQDISIDEVIRDAEAMVEQQIKTKAIEYRYEPCDPGLLVRADSDKVQQILINLLVNAAKYTKEDGCITVSCAVDMNTAKVRVEDTGVGIPAEKLTHIFDAFVQLDRSLNQPREGVGLGLTISRDLAREMGGELRVESVVGRGSVFTLELPLAKAPDSEGYPANRRAEVAAR